MELFILKQKSESKNKKKKTQQAAPIQLALHESQPLKLTLPLNHQITGFDQKNLHFSSRIYLPLFWTHSLQIYNIWEILQVTCSAGICVICVPWPFWEVENYSLSFDSFIFNAAVVLNDDPEHDDRECTIVCILFKDFIKS